jgi:hypothetical protein
VSKKVAICIVGFTRNYKTTLPSLVENLITAKQNEQIIFDLYLVTYEKMYSQDIDDLLRHSVRRINILLLKDSQYSHEYLAAENLILKKYSLNKPLANLANNNQKVYNTLTKCFIPQFHHMELIRDLILETKEEYDLVVKTRFDVLYEEKLNVSEMLSYNIDENIVVPDSNFAYRYGSLEHDKKTKRTIKRTQWGVINDIFIFSTQKNMLKYFSALQSFYESGLFQNLSQFSFKRAESYAHLHVRNLNLGVKFLAKKMGLYRKAPEKL